MAPAWRGVGGNSALKDNEDEDNDDDDEDDDDDDDDDDEDDEDEDNDKACCSAAFLIISTCKNSRVISISC